MGHGGNVIQELTTGHREVDSLFEQIEALPAGDQGRRDLADELTMELIRHSVAEELGEKVRMAKETAPTRPHPAATDTPPANKLLAPGAGMVDRLRDMLTGRGRQG
ncbi:hypothetical protein HTV45_29565 [Streptomyces sp. CHD11]|uniref:hypothetical protein n=1 Tax=Streptomyces sp. CHD11 TaxID=2741325 RepID=UPI001BFCA53B|nr:hypothetical protein [Streptomyces sp. CHD11]MBT3154973.1 hypothetical protein [Streptomyces sp. CHD11]